MVSCWIYSICLCESIHSSPAAILAWLEGFWICGTVVETLEQFLQKYAVLDGANHMDGFWVPLSVAYYGAELVALNKRELGEPSWIKGDTEERRKRLR